MKPSYTYVLKFIFALSVIFQNAFSQTNKEGHNLDTFEIKGYVFQFVAEEHPLIYFQPSNFEYKNAFNALDNRSFELPIIETTCGGGREYGWFLREPFGEMLILDSAKSSMPIVIEHRNGKVLNPKIYYFYAKATLTKLTDFPINRLGIPDGECGWEIFYGNNRYDLGCSIQAFGILALQPIDELIQKEYAQHLKEAGYGVPEWGITKTNKR